MPRAVRKALQALGFLAGLALLVWVVTQAVSKMTAEDWQRLRDASVWQIAGLVALGSFTVAINGLLWWIAIRPVRRVPLTDTTAVNAIATVLAYAPFKISMVFRAGYHKAVDKIPVLTFGGWTFALSAALAAAYIPAIGLRLTPVGGSTPLWLAASVVGAVVAAVVGSALCASLATGAGWRFVRRTAFRIRGRAGLRLVNGPAFTNLHAGTHMLARPTPVVAGAMLRLVDGFSIGARFLIAAAILDVQVDPGVAMVVGLAFFLIGALAPTGAAGVREGGAAGVFALLGVDEAVTPVVVFVAATGVLGELAMGGLAVTWLGPRKLAGAFARSDSVQQDPVNTDPTKPDSTHSNPLPKHPASADQPGPPA